MSAPRRTGRSRFTLLLLVLASVTVLALDFRDSGPVTGLRNAASTLLGPLRDAGEEAGAPFRNGWRGITRYDDLEEENEELQRQIDRLEGEAIRDESAAERLRALEKLEDLRYADGIPAVAGRIISGPLTSFEATIEIDRGSGDGVKEGMAVVNEAGLLGRVVRVYGGRSQVQLITDPQFEFGIQLVNNGDIGVAQGDPDSGRLYVREGIDRRTVVDKGDAVVTSGVQRSAFPPDVPVGRVVSVEPTDDDTEQIVEIEPVADLDGLTYVKVLMWESP